MFILMRMHGQYAGADINTSIYIIKFISTWEFKINLKGLFPTVVLLSILTSGSLLCSRNCTLYRGSIPYAIVARISLRCIFQLWKQWCFGFRYFVYSVCETFKSPIHFFIAMQSVLTFFTNSNQTISWKSSVHWSRINFENFNNL